MESILAVFVFLSLSYGINGSETMTGGVTEVTNEKDRDSYASKALEQLEKLSNNVNARKIIKITKVESQIVSGVKYTVNFTLAMTECNKNIKGEQLKSCKEITGSEREECEITIWEQPWKNFVKIVKQSCKSDRIGTDEKDVRGQEPPLFGTNMINHKRGKYVE